MELELSDHDRAFRDEVRQFIEDSLPDDIRRRVESGAQLPRTDYTRWQQILHQKGWIAPEWPVEYGGTGWSPVQQYVFQEELGLAPTPRIVPFGLVMVAPVIMAFGNEAQKAYYLPRILSSEDFWCQGYSEPGAGSDLASLQTKAVLDGNEYVVTGQKTWITFAQHADMIFCLVRTSQEERRQQGISFLLIDMRSPGVSVNPIKTFDGADDEINEVVFKDVRVPRDNLVGEVGKGWTYAKYLLLHERSGVGALGTPKRWLAKLKQIAREQAAGGRSLIEDPVFRRKLAAVEVELLALEAVVLGVLENRAAGRPPGPESSLLKLRGTELQQAITELGIEAIGHFASPYAEEAFADDPDHESIGPAYAAITARRYFNWRKASIYAGSNEIQKNIISKAVLGVLMSSATNEIRSMLQESVDRFVDREYDFEHRRKLIGSPEGFSREHWATFAELGWLAAAFPEEMGGLSGATADVAVLMEAFGRGLVVEPYLSTIILGGGILSLAGGKGPGSGILPAVMEGEHLVALAHAEAQARFDVADVRTQARREGDDFILDGTKIVALHAGSADSLVISARTSGDPRSPDGLTLFLLDPKASGVSLRSYATIDGFRAADVVLGGVRVGADRVIGEAGEAIQLLEAVFDRAAVAVAAEAVGAMGRLVDTTREYLGTRSQFGVTLSHFQVLQHRVVDMFAEYELSRALVHRAALAVDRDDAKERGRAASVAKAQVGKAGRLVGQHAVQLHGGMGMSDELSVGHYFKRLTMIDVSFGNVDHHLERFARLSLD